MSLQRTGGVCAVVVGVSYVVIGITYLLLPRDQLPTTPASRFLPSYASDPTLTRLLNWEVAFAALFAVGAVIAITELVSDTAPGPARWTGTLAVIGFAVTAVSQFHALAVQPLIASSYVAADASARVAIVAQSNPSVDPDGWLEFGAVGAWAIVSSTLALSGKLIARPIGYVGYVVGVLYVLVVIGNYAHTEGPIAVAAGAGALIFAPVWFVGFGMTLLRRGPASARR